MAIPNWRPLSLAACCLAVAGCATPNATTTDRAGEPVAEPDLVPEAVTILDAAPAEQMTAANEPTALVNNASFAAPLKAPIATSPEITTTWVYLKDRYDADGDGIVTAAEYDRREGQFERWDRDESGTLTGADFEGGSRRRSGSGSSTSMGKTRRTLARYFQFGNDNALLPLAEAKTAFAIYDGSDGTDADGIVNEGEFTCSMGSRQREVPGDDSPMVQRAMGDDAAWTVLISGLDRDEDKALSIAEIEHFYSDVMKTDTIDYSDWTWQGGPRPIPASRPDGAAAADDLAAQEGQTAPDFTLSSPDGTLTATLSQHIGSLPVALIFGSYT